VGIDPRGGDDLLRVFGTPNSDTIAFLKDELMVNSQPFVHDNFESFAVLAGSGNDIVGVAQALAVAGSLHIDGADGNDLLLQQLDGASAQLMLPGVVQDSRLVTTAGVERFTLQGTVDEFGQPTDVLVSGAADASRSVTATPLATDRVSIRGGDFSFDLTTDGTITISSVTPPMGSELSIRHVEVNGTVFDDTMNVTATAVDFAGILKTVDLFNIPSVSVVGNAGLDTFNVTPSATTTVHIDGGDPIGFGDVLNIVATVAPVTRVAGPANDSGGIAIVGMKPVNYVRVETVEFPNRPVGIALPGPVRDGLPELKWHSVFDVVSYEVELVNLTVIGEPSVIAVVDNFFRPVTPLALGKYQFRVRGVYANSEKTEFSDPVSFEVRTQVSFLNDRISRHELPKLEWIQVAGAIRYDLWVDNQTTGERQVIRKQNLTEPMFTPIEPLPIGQYNVWVKPYGVPDFGGTWKVSTLQVMTPTKIIAPSGGVIDGRPTFEWSDVPGAETWDLWVRQLSPVYVDQFIRVQDLVGRSFTPTVPLPAGSYIFWVQPQGANNYQSSWGTGGSHFQTFAEPIVIGPRVNSPTANPDITWTGIQGAASYDLEVIDADGNLVIGQTQLNSTKYVPATPFASGSEFFIRVRLRDTAGNLGNWSPEHRFATPPDAVTLRGPVGAGSAGPIRFSWNAVTGAERYELWVSRLDVLSRVIHRETFTETEFDSHPLPAGRFRFWVRAFNSEGREGDWSQPFDFMLTMTDRLSELDSELLASLVPGAITNVGISQKSVSVESPPRESDNDNSSADVLLLTEVRTQASVNLPATKAPAIINGLDGDETYLLPHAIDAAFESYESKIWSVVFNELM
jgi:hypothetical protein